MKIGVTYAVYCTNATLVELACQTLESIRSEHELSFLGVLNAPLHNRPLLERFGPLIENEENNLSRAWNRGIDRLLNEGCEVVFVPNLDIIVAPYALDILAERRNEFILWTMAPWGDRDLSSAPRSDHWLPHPHFSAFMVDHHLFEKVGPFDENLKPAYNEDLDMHWRIRLAGFAAGQYEAARFYHHGSATITHDPDLRERNGVTHARNDEYFVQKWGYKPPTADDPFTAEMYRYPFNDPARVGMEKQVVPTW